MPPPLLKEPTKKDIESEEEADEARTRKKSAQYQRMDWMMKEGLIKKGDQVYVICKPDEIATVKDENEVIYDGKPMSFNRFGCQITGWSAYQTYAYTKIVGVDETLSKLRQKRMRELGMLED